MKLELKHLASYLPYDLKFKGELKHDSLLPFDDSREILPFDAFVLTYIDQEFEYVKPILRPLSDLTNKDMDIMIEHSDFESVHLSKTFSQCYYDELIFINSEDKTYLSSILKQCNYLFEHHFDVFGLIDKGLAIDINTL